MRTQLPCLALLAAVTSAATSQSAADLASAAEIRALFEQFNAAWERRDSAFIDRFYAHDTGAVFFFERRQLVGWPQVDTLYRNMFASAARGRVRSLYDVLDVGARGDVGWLAANFRLEVAEATGDTTVDEGRQTIVVERRDGRWVVMHRHTSFQAPPGAQRRVPLHTTPGPLWLPADDTTGGPDAREVRRLRGASNAAIARHDTAGIGATFSSGVVIVTSTSATLTGREAVLQAFADDFRTHPDIVYRRTTDEVRIYAPWHMASERGAWNGSWTEADSTVRIGGSYFAKWRQVNGAWLIETETYVMERCSGSTYCGAVP